MLQREIQYRSITDMGERITASLDALPSDLDMVVGVPRSGMIAATLIALYRNLPMTDLEGLFEGRMIKSGRRTIEQINMEGSRCKVLVVDDSVGAGTQMRAAKERLKPLEDKFEFVFAAVFVSETGSSLVDIAMEICPQPRCFQWNVMNHYLMQRACVDVLSLLPGDVSKQATISRELPQIWQQTPLFKPKYKLASLVVPAYSTEREMVEKWMQQHGLSCKELVLAGRQWQAYAKARLKAQRKRPIQMAFEFSRTDALRAAAKVGVPVFSSECFAFFQPPFAAKLARKVRRFSDRFRKQEMVEETGERESRECVNLRVSAK